MRRSLRSRLVLVALAVAFVGCSGNPDAPSAPSSSTAAEGAPPPEAKEKVKFGRRSVSAGTMKPTGAAD